jgi:hybrid cluster-associated redox disulfide protein
MQDRITKEMTFGELIKSFPQAGRILADYGLHCIGCHIATFETIEQGARAHGLQDGEISKMLGELNQIAI